MQNIYLQKIKNCILAVYLVLLMIAAGVYSVYYPIPELIEKIVQTLFFGVACISMLLYGRVVIRYFFLRNDAVWWLENHTLAFRSIIYFGIGVCVSAVILYCLGVTGLMYPLSAWAAVVLPIGLNIKYGFIKQIGVVINELREDWVNYTGYLGIILVFVLSVVLLSCYAPVTYYDSLVYHMSLPGYYVQQHRIVPVEGNLFSYFPQNMELMYAFMLLLGSEYGANLLSYVFLLGIIVLIRFYSKKYLNEKSGIYATILYSLTPAVMLLSGSTYVETGLAFFVLLLFICINEYVAEDKFIWIVLAGIIAGFAVGIKYTAALGGAGAVLILLLKKKFVPVLWLVGIAVITFLPWAIRNYLGTGNPVYPFFYQIFSGNGIWSAEMVKGYFGVLTEYSMRSNAVIELLNFPLWLFNQPLRYGGGIDVLGDIGWIWYLLFLPSIFFSGRFANAGKMLGIYAAVIFFGWFFTKQVLRFLVPLLPVLALLSGIGLAGIEQILNRAGKVVVYCVLVLMVVSNLFLYFMIHDITGMFPAAMGVQIKHDYLAAKINYYPVAEVVNKYVDKGGKVLLIGDQRGYYYECQFRITNVFVQDGYFKTVNNARDISEVEQFLVANHYNHIVFNEPEFKRLQSYESVRFTDRGWKLHNEVLEKKFKKVVSCNGVTLYARA